MRSDTWRPFSERTTATDPSWRPGMSKPLETSLRYWLDGGHTSSHMERILLRCTLSDHDNCKNEHNNGVNEHFADAVDDDGPDVYAQAQDHLAYCTPKRRLLDVIDAWLHLHPPARHEPGTLGQLIAIADPGPRKRASLQEILDDALSVYTIAPDLRGLCHRVDPTAEALIDLAAAGAAAAGERGSAAQHLRNALKAATALVPEPERAYSEAIKAVEAAAHRTVEPNNTKATLGTMARVLRDGAARFTVEIGAAPGAENVQAVEAMMSMLWRGQTSRHGGRQETRRESPAQALMAVHLAAALVHLFAADVLHRVPPAA